MIIVLMANHSFSVAVLPLLVFSLLSSQQVKCQQSAGFRVFRTDAELREFNQLSARERLDAALLYPGAEILEITGENQAATVQEGTNLYIDCLPWLQQFQPNGSIQWYSIQLDENGNVISSTYVDNYNLKFTVISTYKTVLNCMVFKLTLNTSLKQPPLCNHAWETIIPL